MVKARTAAELTRSPPPTCLPSTCTNCTCSAERWYRTEPIAPQQFSDMRVFFFDGHSGPMNDMFATLRSMGVAANNMEAMVMAQAEQKRKFVDLFQGRMYGGASPSPERCVGRLLGKRPTLAMHSWLRGKGRLRLGPIAGATLGKHMTRFMQNAECTTLPTCERKRCRDALVSDGLRREFAKQFGEAIEATVDVVACNFPTWQCSMFMYVRVAIVMRFTHRWDHHLQGYYVDPGVALRPPATWSEAATASDVSSGKLHANASAALRASAELTKTWREARRNHRTLRAMNARGTITPLPKAALQTLRTMAAQPNVVLAASNPYDAMYIRRAFGQDPLPWPGTSPQLARIQYTGDRSSRRPEIIFCCGNSAYNSAILHVATLIVNATEQRAASTSSLSRSVDAAQAASSTAPLLFRWPQEVYRPSWACDKHNKSQAPVPQALTPPVSHQCGYKYTDLASHPIAVLLPYSVHSYGVVQAYAMGVPLLAPAPALLADWHTTYGFVGHKGPGNTPWRRSAERKRVPNDAFAWLTHDMRAWWSPPADPDNMRGCAHDPNDACNTSASLEWLQFSEPYTWPHVTYFHSIDDLLIQAQALMLNTTRRRQLSDGMKAFFKSENERALGHARFALTSARQAAAKKRSLQKTPMPP